MGYQVEVVEAKAWPLASVRGRANAKTISKEIVALLDIVWARLRAAGAGWNDGINVCIYDCTESNFFSEEGVPIEAGVGVPEDFSETDQVKLSFTPAGRIAKTVHVGSYSGLPEAHAAIHAWSEQNGETLTGINWEVYGHWTENENELRTDVCYLLS